MAKKPLTDADVLRAARKLIDTPEKWTQGAYSRDEGGIILGSDMTSAVCFCGIGAVLAAAQQASSLASEATREAEAYLAKAVGGDFINWQDAPERTHAEVLAAFDRAIALADAANNTKAGA